MLAHLLAMVGNDRDTALLNDMYVQYQQLTLQVAMAVLKNHDDAEDAAMATWAKVAEHFDAAKALYRYRKDFEPWLVLIAKNAARDECRKRKRAPLPIEMREIPASDNTEMDAERRMAFEVIQSLPEQYSRILEMHMFGGYGFKEIGKSLGCSTSTAQRRFKQAVAAAVELVKEKRGY